MENQDGIIDDLSKKIERLTQQHQSLYQEIQQIQKSVDELKHGSQVSVAPEAPKPVTPENTYPPILSMLTKENFKAPVKAKVKQRTPIEEFIGTNLLNKIGIAILVIGIGFGTKYAIDHDMLSPLTRIILGYLSGVVIIGFAIQLKKKYENFSAVLLSGGMAVLYFVTYAAYDFYNLIPQAFAFLLMVLFTAFTTFAAVQYNLQTIAIIGLVGAYGVPFLLSDGSGRVTILFSYMSIINTGILVLAFKKYWKNLYYLAFVLTWLIFGAWYGTQYLADAHFWISLSFATVFFLIFYATFLSYKLIRTEPLEKLDIACMMANSFLYFGFGYATISSVSSGESYLGLFTVFTALIHFIACVVIYRSLRDQAKDILYFVAGMVLVFITLAVPVQLEGNWVTLIWAVEAVILFWIGRTKAFPVYEKISYVLILLASISLLHDWNDYYKLYAYFGYDSGVVHEPIRLFLNIQFFTSLWVAASLGVILKLSLEKKYASPLKEGTSLNTLFTFALPAIFGTLVYFAFFKEIQLFWDRLYIDSAVQIKSAENGDYTLYDNSLISFQTLWLINYSAIFGIVLSVVAARFIKDKTLTYAAVILNALVITAFLTSGLVELASLRSNYLEQSNVEYYFRGPYHIVIRYIGILFVLPLIVCNHWFIKKTMYFNENLERLEHVLFHLVVITFLSSELVHWLDMARVENSFKLSLSILWGAYALFLIILGLMRDWKHTRIMAFALFGITLLKLFLYDMADMSTIAKTVVMMILGVLLLIASFLYNKYKRSNETH